MRVQEYVEDVKLREEKAISEKKQLARQEKLKLDRVQWQKQAHQARTQEDALVSNLSCTRTTHAATLHQLRTDNQYLQDTFVHDLEEYAAFAMFIGLKFDTFRSLVSVV